MNFSPKDSKLLHFWQSLHFEAEAQSNHDDAELSRKVDSLRSLMNQVDVLSSSSISSFSREHLLQQYSDKYCKLVDEQDISKGLNNFAEPVLSLLAGHNNDSENWQSSLSLEEIKNTSLWQDIVNKQKPPEARNKVHLIPSTSTSPQGHEYAARFPAGAKEKDWSININTGHTAIEQGKSKPPNTGLAMDDNMSNKRKLHFVYPADYPEPNSVKFPCGNQESRPPPSGLPQPTEGNNRYNRVPLSSKDNQEPSRFSMNNDDNYASRPSKFITAKQQYIIDSKNKNQKSDQSNRAGGASGYGGNARKTLGTRRGPSSKFVPPVPRNSSDEESSAEGGGCIRRRNGDTRDTDNSGIELDERLKNIEPKMVELIMNEIMDHGPPITWNDIAGLEFAKNVIKEIVVWPMLRPDIFKGLRGPPKGLLLFGPPGTGKTLIGKCIASQSKATFFSISASSLTSKWVGEGEKMVRALFAVARCHLPAVIFIDEIDSLLTQRTDGEHEASRRIKTEFLVQLDGATTNTDERLLVVGATNRPQEIDEAARRRLVKRLYIPLPDGSARHQIICNLLSQQSYSLTDKEIGIIVSRTEGYSGSDMSNLCREAAIGPIRCLATADIEHITADQVRPIELQDFESALSQVRASVSDKDLNLYIEWNTLYGSGSK